MTPEQFIGSAWLQVCDLSLLLANQPDDRVTATLDQMSTNLNEQMAAVFPGQAEAIIDGICKGIMDRMHEIERAGGATNPTRH
jgi:hypothetical protein